MLWHHRYIYKVWHHSLCDIIGLMLWCHFQIGLLYHMWHHNFACNVIMYDISHMMQYHTLKLWCHIHSRMWYCSMVINITTFMQWCQFILQVVIYNITAHVSNITYFFHAFLFNLISIFGLIPMNKNFLHDVHNVLFSLAHTDNANISSTHDTVFIP